MTPNIRRLHLKDQQTRRNADCPGTGRNSSRSTCASPGWLDQDLHRSPRLCAAIVDRLTFAGQIIETGTVSYRLAHARQQHNASKAASAPAR